MDASSLLLFGALIVALIAMMFFSSRRRKREAQTMQQKMQVGARIMTGSGIFGTILELVPDENDVVQKVIIETAPGQTLTMHRQAITRYLDEEVPAEDEVPAEAAEDSAVGEVELGHTEGAVLNGEPVETDAEPRRARRKSADEV